ncbi:MAG: alpha/beta fold hydrolase [Candidatus Saccharibacteria bacterium]
MIIENKFIKTPDGFNIYTEIRTPENGYKQTIVMLHGLTGTIDGGHQQLLQLANTLCDNGFRVIRFNWRGHEKSSGIDLDVCPTSFQTDLNCVISSECQNITYDLFGFSFGGFAVSQYLCTTKDTIDKIVLWGPALDPIGSSFRNPKEFCYQEIFEAEQNGSLEKDGYVLWKSKNWKISKDFIDQCDECDYKKALQQLSKRTLVIQGKNDRNVDYEFNKKYASEYGFDYIELDASHSLYEKIDEAIENTLKFFNK